VALIDILIPTCGRKTGLAVLLASLNAQTFTDFDVVISDQTPEQDAYLESIEIDTLVRALRWHGHQVTLHRHLPRRGMGEQRQFLLDQSQARYVYYVDDDVLLDSSVLERLVSVIRHEGCGFVGTAATGLDFLDDERPDQQQIELWHGPVEPEPFEPEGIPWDRHKINNAANPLHLERRLVHNGSIIRYKVAWVGGASVLYDREKLLSVGGFSWWDRLPPSHAGEEVLAQFLLMRDYGGCGILPSGTYHLGLPTTISDRQRNATELFAQILSERQQTSRELQPQPSVSRELVSTQHATQGEISR
jgi:glycosyltransferase involved in cell wall biosynthesis